jgi:HSP20 family protein
MALGNDVLRRCDGGADEPRHEEDTMPTVSTTRTPASPLTELFDWLESGWPGVTAWHREGARALRIEDRMDEDRYLVRAELPGIDPDKDVQITIDHGVLSIAGERRESSRTPNRSEFHYGSFVRRVSLPSGADENAVSASYHDGILEVAVPIEPSRVTPRAIPVAHVGGPEMLASSTEEATPTSEDAAS